MAFISGLRILRIVIYCYRNNGLCQEEKSEINSYYKEERHLCHDFLCSCPVRFSGQKVSGKYIADFYCAEAKLVIEPDGLQHYEDINVKKNAGRTVFPERYGLRVIRIPDNETGRNFRGVCEYIDAAARQSPKSASFTKVSPCGAAAAPL